MTVIRPAAESDGPTLIAFFRETPVRAGTAFVLDRGPDFQALLRLRGEARTIVAVRDERIVGSVTALWHSGVDGDRVVRVGELMDLRVAPEGRGGRIAARLLEGAAAAFDEVGADYVLCLIGDRNREAARLVMGGAGLPALHPVGHYASVHYPAWRVPTRRHPDVSVRPAVPADAGVLAALVEETVTERRFRPETLFPWPDPRHSHHGWVAEDGSGRPIGGLVVWDPMAVRRVRIRRYSAQDQLFRGLMAFGSLLGVARALPRPDEPLRIWASRWLGVRESPRGAVPLLIRTALRDSATAGQHILQINFEEQDPLFRFLPGLPRSVYWSTLYGRPLRGGRVAPVDAGICHTDVALV
jgi:hypothetical protein